MLGVFQNEVVNGDKKVVGLIRVLNAEVETIIAHSGKGGVFIDTVSRERLKYSVTKIVRSTGEAPGDHLARALATKPTFGHFCPGK